MAILDKIAVRPTGRRGGMCRVGYEAALVVFVAAAAIPLAGSAEPTNSDVTTAEAETVLPGYWERKLVETSPVHEEVTSRLCVTPERIRDFMRYCGNSLFEYNTDEVGGGRILLHGRWTIDDGKAGEVSVLGNYSAEELHSKVVGHSRIAFLPIVTTVTIEAHRVSNDCPPGSMADSDG